MTNRESKLLIFLIFFSLAVLFFLTFQNSASDIKEANQTIEKYTEMTQKLQNKKQIEKNDTKNSANVTESKLQTSEITDLIIKDLKRAEIVPMRYQIAKDSKGEFIEVSLSTSNTRLAKYFKQFKADVYPYTISVFNIKTDADKVNASIRYSVVPSKIVNNSSSEKSYPVERLFRPVYKNTVVQNTVVATPVKSEEKINYNKEYIFIGRVKDNDGIEYMYLKNSNTNRILKIAPKDILSEDNEKYLVSSGSEKFYIRKED
jgi:hypothetical protein